LRVDSYDDRACRHQNRTDCWREDDAPAGQDTCGKRNRFLLGKSPTTGRNFYMFFGVDGELMSVKWQYYKAIFRYAPGPALEAINHGYVTPPLPMFFDLSSDPHEDYNLWTTTMTMGWVYGPVGEVIALYEKSVREYPNIKPGDEFKGYERSYGVAV
jgi:arylsulfatase